MNKFLVIAGLVGLFFLVRMTSDSGQWESFVEDNGDRYQIDMSSVGPLSRESTIVGEKDVARAMMYGPGHAQFYIELWCDTPLFKMYDSAHRALNHTKMPSFFPTTASTHVCDEARRQAKVRDYDPKECAAMNRKC